MSYLRKLHVAQNNVLQCCPTWLPGAVMIQNRQKIMSKLWVRHRMKAPEFFSRELCSWHWHSNPKLKCLETFQRNDLGPNATSELSQAHPGKRLNWHSFGSNFEAWCCILLLFTILWIPTLWVTQEMIMSNAIKINVLFLCAGCGDFFCYYE